MKAIEGFDTAGIAALCERYMQEAGPFGEGAADVDTVVLGCTHYPLVIDELRKHAPATLRFIDTGRPVALHTRRLLGAAGQLASDASGTGALRLESSGQVAALEVAAARWLGLSSAAA